jgi:hypothetical protein
MATLSSRMLPSGVATLGQGALADTAVQPNDSPTFNALTVNGNSYPSAGALSNRNLIINGAMTVAQRGTSTPGVVGDGFYSCDRFKTILGSLGTHTVTQAADGPSGFASSYKVEVTTANASPAAASYHLITSKFEGQDLQRLSKGTPSAKQLTASFWVESNLTGTYILNILDLDNSRQIASTYTISVSGTWQYVTVVFPADTTGTFNDDNGPSLEIGWWLASGTNYNSGATPVVWETTTDADRNAGSNVNLGATIGNYWQITGVQLEVGDTATPFEFRSYGQELALCQRYYERIARINCGSAVRASSATNDMRGSMTVVPKRASPTVTVGTVSPGFAVTQNGVFAQSTGVFNLYEVLGSCTTDAALARLTDVTFDAEL